jgi:hypothetical protein
LRILVEWAATGTLFSSQDFSRIYESGTPRLLSYTFGNDNDVPLSQTMARPSMVDIR